MARYTCSKVYSRLPAAHRQHLHDGHCALIHGHDWSFKITFVASELDENGFVVDFGKLREVKAALEADFDHTLLINKDDPELPYFKDMNKRGLCKLVVVNSASAEGLAKRVADNVRNVLAHMTGGRVWVLSVVCREDDVNEAEYRP